MNAARRIADGVIKAAIVRSPLLSQYLSRKHRRILTGGNRAGEHSATPILNTQLAINNGVPAFRNHATKATFAGRRYLGLDSCPLGGGLKHDGFRVIARKSGAQVRLYSRPGNDLTHRLIIDGEAVARDDNGVTSFNRVRYCHHDESIFRLRPDRTEWRRSPT